MAYDRYENRGSNRDRWRDDDRERGSRQGSRDQDERGFFERARDEVTSWFGDESSGHPDDHRRSYGARDHDQRGQDHRGGAGDRDPHWDSGNRSRGNFGGGQSSSMDRAREREYSSRYSGSGESGGFGRSQDDRYGRGQSFGQHDRDPGRFGGRFGRDDDDYRPMTGDYGRGGERERSNRSGMGGQDFSRSQYGRQDFSQDQDRDRGRTYAIGGWGDRDSMRQSRGNERGSGHHTDPHYHEWRQRQLSELDRDYDDYRREHQSKFENEFSGWRQQRQTKRQMLQSIQEHMEVVGSDHERVGTVDKVRGDKVILAKSDPESGGVHRSFTCSLLEQVEGDKVILSQPAEQAKRQLQREDENDRSSGGGFMSGLFGRSDDDRDDDHRTRDRGDHPTDLNRSFSGTYER